MTKPKHTISKNRLQILFFASLIFLFSSSQLLSLGTYAEGWAVIKLTRMEESGIIFSSYEGKFEIADFDPSEKCNDKDYECYTRKTKEMAFSARPENTKLINFLKDHEGQKMLVKYRCHRIEAAALSSDFEFLEAHSLQSGMPEGLPKTIRVEKAGSKRSFSIYGRLLRLEYRGTLVGTWEGIYLDAKRNKIHPFSVTDERMANYLAKTMLSTKPFYMMVSQAYAAPIRDSDYDVFAVDYDKVPRAEPSTKEKEESSTKPDQPTKAQPSE